MQFKVCNTGATYITVFEGICQFLKTLRKYCNVKGTLLHLELRPGLWSVTIQKRSVIAGDPGTVVKICCDLREFLWNTEQCGEPQPYHMQVYQLYTWTHTTC